MPTDRLVCQGATSYKVGTTFYKPCTTFCTCAAARPHHGPSPQTPSAMLTHAKAPSCTPSSAQPSPNAPPFRPNPPCPPCSLPLRVSPIRPPRPQPPRAGQLARLGRGHHRRGADAAVPGTKGKVVPGFRVKPYNLCPSACFLGTRISQVGPHSLRTLSAAMARYLTVPTECVPYCTDFARRENVPRGRSCTLLNCTDPDRSSGPRESQQSTGGRAQARPLY